MIRSHYVMLFTVLAVVGCGGGGEPVTGTVTRGGTPVFAGAVLLEPVEYGPSSTAAISDGQFTVPGARGLKPGKYKVRVSPPPVVPGPDPKVIPKPLFPVWESTVEVVAGQPVVLALPNDEPGAKPKPRVPGKP